MEKNQIHELIEVAMTMEGRAYAPYSHFSVGAALLGTDGVIYGGANVENSSYGLSMCAERNALFHAIGQGCQSFQVIAITSSSGELTPPCGACRQVMAEFSVPLIILGRHDRTYVTYTLADILPHSFQLEGNS